MLSDRTKRTVCSTLYRYVANGSKFDERYQRCFAIFGKRWGTKVLSQPGENHEPDIQEAVIRCERPSEDYAGVLAGHNYGHRSERVGLLPFSDQVSQALKSYLPDRLCINLM